MVLLPGGGPVQYVTVPEGLFMLMPMHIPAGLTLPEVAAIPKAWLTAFQLLYSTGEEDPRPPEPPPASPALSPKANCWHQLRPLPYPTFISEPLADALTYSDL